MNAHSEWVKWSQEYRIPPPDPDPCREFPMMIRYDWKGVGMEGAFKAGYNARPLTEPMPAAVQSVMTELACAEREHGPILNRHEAYAIIKEEIDEYWEKAKRKNPHPRDLEDELIQVAAMAVRTIKDVLQ